MLPRIDAKNDSVVQFDLEIISSSLALFVQTEAPDPWLKYHKEIAPNLVAIANLRPTTDILILQG